MGHIPRLQKIWDQVSPLFFSKSYSSKFHYSGKCPSCQHIMMLASLSLPSWLCERLLSCGLKPSFIKNKEIRTLTRNWKLNYSFFVKALTFEKVPTSRFFIIFKENFFLLSFFITLSADLKRLTSNIRISIRNQFEV